MQYKPLQNESLTALASTAARLPYCPILFTLPIMQKKIGVQKGPVYEGAVPQHVQPLTVPALGNKQRDTI